MRIAIIGVGEVGRCFAEPLQASGAELLLCEPKPSEAALALATAWKLRVHPAPGEWLHSADWLLSCVPGSQALAVVEQCLPFMPANAGLADLTTASPDAKRRAATLAVRRSVRYVDTAIMSAISLSGVRTPLLDAISLKFLRSLFTKGMEALAVELLTSAEKQGVREELYAQLGDIDRTPLRSFIDMLVRTHVIHAGRRAHEVQQAQTELASLGIPSLVLPGVEKRFLATVRKLERHQLGTADPSVDQALQWLLATPEPA